MVHGVPMRSALDADGCEIVLKFFAMLLKIKDPNRTNNKINVGAALGVWNQNEYGKSKISMSARKSPSVTAMRRKKAEMYDDRRAWLAEHPNGTYAEAAKAWGVIHQAAYQWIIHERVRQGRIRMAN